MQGVVMKNGKVPLNDFGDSGKRIFRRWSLGQSYWNFEGFGDIWLISRLVKVDWV